MSDDGPSTDLLQGRERRINDAVALREPDRVPVMAVFGFLPARMAGITFEEAMFDYDKTMEAWTRAMVEFQPDAYDDPYPSRFWGRIMERLGYKQMRWPGHGVRPNLSFQYVEDEYMKAEEYDEFLDDKSDYVLRKYWPRIFESLRAFEDLPPAPCLYSYSGFGKLANLDTPQIQKTLKNLMSAAREARKMLGGSAAYAEAMKRLGFPPQFGAMTHTPFDVLSDFFRGTIGAMLDMYRVPDKLLAAVERMYDNMLQNGLSALKTGTPRVFIPLHKGADTFMSRKQFEVFYWPTLRRLIIDLVHNGLTPFVFWEGDCTAHRADRGCTQGQGCLYVRGNRHL